MEQYGYQQWWEDKNKLSDLVSMILIQQTTEKNAKAALAQLENYLTVEALLEIEEEDLQELIKPAGFYKQKTKYIKSVIEWLDQKGRDFEIFDGYSTEFLRTELLSVRGIGPETADVILLYIFKRNVFVADQYAIRLFNRLGIGKYKNYQDLQKDFNHLTNGVSNQICREWHAVIDIHGKHYNANKEMDESWLTNS